MFGMASDLSRKKKDRRVSANRLPKGAYHLDKRLVPRVKEVGRQAGKLDLNMVLLIYISALLLSRIFNTTDYVLSNLNCQT